MRFAFEAGKNNRTPGLEKFAAEHQMSSAVACTISAAAEPAVADAAQGAPPRIRNLIVSQPFPNDETAAGKTWAARNGANIHIRGQNLKNCKLFHACQKSRRKISFERNRCLSSNGRSCEAK